MDQTLKLIGLTRRDAPPGDHGLELEAFSRIRTEVDPGPGTTRLIGLTGGPLRFLGIEVASLDNIPPGMVGWEFSDNHLGVTCDGTTEVAEVDWTWRAGLADDPRRWLGECSLTTGSESLGLPPETPLTLFAHVPFACDRDFDDDVLLSEPDPAWPDRAATIMRDLRRELSPDILTRLEHYGSTSLKDMPSKPLIDLLGEVPSFDVARRGVLSRLNSRTWEYWWYVDHMILIHRATPMGRRLCHLHLGPPGHRLWEGLVFRDYLEANPDIARQYADLKRRLAEQFGHDRERYTAEKGAFVRRVTDQALQAAKQS